MRSYIRLKTVDALIMVVLVLWAEFSTRVDNYCT